MIKRPALGLNIQQSAFSQTPLIRVLAVLVLLFAMTTPFWSSDVLHAASVSQGPRTATASGDCVNDATGGATAWTNPGNAYKSDTTYATATLAKSGVTQYIKCTNFGFSLVSGVTINGITMTVKHMASTASRASDSRVSIVKGGVVGTSNYKSASAWATTDETFTYGSVSDLWGTTWTASDINATNFGGVIAVAASNPVTASVDAITLTVQYTYTPPTFAQSAYRWFSNQDATTNATFANTWGGTGGDVATTNFPTSDSGNMVAGYTSSFGAGNNDAMLIKYNAAGMVSWSRTLGGTGQDYAYDTIQTTDGGYVFTGMTYSWGDTANGDMIIAKYASDGTFSWSKTWGGTLADYGNKVIQTADGGFIITGKTSSYGVGGTVDSFLAKYASDGTFSWSKTWGGGTTDYGNNVIETTDGGYAVTGYSGSWVAGYSMFLAKFTSSGDMSWGRLYGGDTASSTEFGNFLAQTADGGYVVYGSTTTYGAGLSDIFIAKYTSDGTFSWSKTWGGTGTETPSEIAITPDGGLLASGRTNSFGAGGYDGFLVKLTSSGALTWNVTFGGTLDDVFKSARITADGGYSVTGYTLNYGAGGNEVVTVKYLADGTVPGCATPLCQTPSATMRTDGVNYTSMRKTDGVDYTSTRRTDGVDYTSTRRTDGTDYTSTQKSEGTDYTATTTSLIGLTSPPVDVSAPLNSAALNTATTALATQQPFRLRVNLHVSTNPAPANVGLALRLEYAARGIDATCDTSFTGETYAPVTSSTPIAYANNPVAIDGASAIANANDPTHNADTKSMQEYNESNTTGVINNIAVGEDGIWDFALKDNGAPARTAYCFRVTDGTGGVIGGYSVIPQITTLPAAPVLNEQLRGGQSVIDGYKSRLNF